MNIEELFNQNDMNNLKKIILIGISIFTSIVLSATVLKMPDVFSNNMVLQQGKPVAIWGSANSNAKVVVSFAGQIATTTADRNGKWKLFLKKLKISTKPNTLSIISDTVKIEFANVLVGEVWLCSGQSNMFYPLGIIDGNYSGVENGEIEIENASYPLIRIYCDSKHEYWNAKQWQECSPATIRGFSSTAYFFGRELFQKLNVPIGILNISRGGSLAQAWTPVFSAEKVPFVKKQMDIAIQKKTEIQQYFKNLQQLRKEKISIPINDSPTEIEMASRYTKVGSLYDVLIKPLAPFTLSGVVWYQGEGNSRFSLEANNYSDLLTAMIKGWRKEFDQNLYFIVAQLPIFATGVDQGPNFYIIRNQQRLAVNAVGTAGLAILYDFCSVNNLHPPQKQETGRRISLWALADVYKQKIIPSGPLFKNAIFVRNNVICDFYNSDGLVSADNQELRAFELAGKDGIFYTAIATIKNNKVVISSSKVKHPTKVNYFYGNDNQSPNLTNNSGLPASGFIFPKNIIK